MTSVVRFDPRMEPRDGTMTILSYLTHLDLIDGGLGWEWSFVDVGENLPYQVKSFFSTDKSILLTLIENLYFTLLLIRQKMYDRDWIATWYSDKISVRKQMIEHSYESLEE